MSIVADTVLTFLPPDRKQTPSGWISFNAPCCIHNGESRDTKKRGGVIQEGEGVSYHCFNCGFKASWQPGRNLSHKMRNLLQWLGTPDDTINKLALDVMRENEGVETRENLVQVPSFNAVPLPPDAIKIKDMEGADQVSQSLYDVVHYMQSRQLYLDDYDFYWSPSLGYRDRLIIPFKYEGNTVGWTARTIKADKKPKYLSEQQPGYVFNLDDQGPNKLFTIVVEGPVDAIYIEGVALLGSEIKDQQALLINRLNKDVIVVPDKDAAGRKLVNQAIELGWQVSMPEWAPDINDVGDAVLRYGRLYTLHSIVTAAESSALKIRLREKKWFT